MPEFLDYDPDTGLRHEFSFDEETGEATIHYESDISALLDYNKALANSDKNNAGIKKNWWLYAKLPAIWYIKMRARGFKLDSTDDTSRLLAEINTHAPALKCTQLNHGKKLAVIYDLGSKTGTSTES